ncbi:hypothetical protein GCM10027590_36810 [Nocardiopsis nanhaiensis]
MTDRQESRDAGSPIPAAGRPWLAAALARLGGTFRGQGFGVATAEQAPRKDEVLLDANDIQLGHQPELRWNSEAYAKSSLKKWSAQTARKAVA